MPKDHGSIVSGVFLYIFMAKFKKWFHEYAMHGGFYDALSSPGNSNMPVRSKTQTKDGAPIDDEPFDIEPAKLFGFRKWMSKTGKKRLTNSIHKSRSVRTGVPIQNDRPMM